MSLPVKEFFGVYNSTFRFLEERFGREALEDYWRYIGEDFLAHWIALVREKGTEGMREYWTKSLEDEGADYDLTASPDEFVITMRRCPAIGWLKEHGADIFDDYCGHCKVLWGHLGELAGFSLEIKSDQEHGTCTLHYRRKIEPEA